ncbi:MAG: hypothetical protein AAF671_05810 [Pseudomonadota bacterium]
MPPLPFDMERPAGEKSHGRERFDVQVLPVGNSADSRAANRALPALADRLFPGFWVFIRKTV